LLADLLAMPGAAAAPADMRIVLSALLANRRPIARHPIAKQYVALARTQPALADLIVGRATAKLVDTFKRFDTVAQWQTLATRIRRGHDARVQLSNNVLSTSLYTMDVPLLLRLFRHDDASFKLVYTGALHFFTYHDFFRHDLGLTPLDAHAPDDDDDTPLQTVRLGPRALHTIHDLITTPVT